MFPPPSLPRSLPRSLFLGSVGCPARRGRQIRAPDCQLLDPVQVYPSARSKQTILWCQSRHADTERAWHRRCGGGMGPDERDERAGWRLGIADRQTDRPYP